MKKISTEAYILTASIGLCLGILSGCTFKVGVDYTGKSGIDNRTATSLTADAHPVRRVGAVRPAKDTYED